MTWSTSTEHIRLFCQHALPGLRQLFRSIKVYTCFVCSECYKGGDEAPQRWRKMTQQPLLQKPNLHSCRESVWTIRWFQIGTLHSHLICDLRYVFFFFLYWLWCPSRITIPVSSRLWSFAFVYICFETIFKHERRTAVRLQEHNDKYKKKKKRKIVWDILSLRGPLSNEKGLRLRTVIFAG